MPDQSAQAQTAHAAQKLTALKNIAGAQHQRFIADVLTARPTVMYCPGDYKAIRKLIYDNVAAAVQSRFPLVNQRYMLDVQDLKYEGPQDFTLEQQKNAILQNKSLGRRLRGRWVLTDARTNKKVATTNPVTLMNVPYITDRGTFIRGGSEYTFNNIMRLQPGVYTKKNNDNEVTAQFNIKRGTGAGFGIKFTPSTGLFYINKGTRNVPAYTVLRSMGVTDQALQKSWGKQLLDINKQAGTGQRAYAAQQKLYRS